MNWKLIFVGVVKVALVIVPYELGNHFEIDLLKYLAIAFLTVIVCGD